MPCDTSLQFASDFISICVHLQTLQNAAVLITNCVGWICHKMLHTLLHNGHITTKRRSRYYKMRNLLQNTSLLQNAAEQPSKSAQVACHGFFIRETRFLTNSLVPCRFKCSPLALRCSLLMLEYEIVLHAYYLGKWFAILFTMLQVPCITNINCLQIDCFTTWDLNIT